MTRDARGQLKAALQPVWDEVVEVLAGDGNGKHGLLGWQRGRSYRLDLDKAIGHLADWRAGRTRDPDSGLSPLDHAMARLAVLRDRERRGIGEDDR